MVLKQITALGDTIEDTSPGFTKIRCPDVYIPEMPIAGIWMKTTEKGALRRLFLFL